MPPGAPVADADRHGLLEQPSAATTLSTRHAIRGALVYELDDILRVSASVDGAASVWWAVPISVTDR